ncbi:MAG: PAS domain S-box protein [Anaerolineae bacterium]|nr:PAS domain S-box protein [Anaerolineae bacterium]
MQGKGGKVTDGGHSDAQELHHRLTEFSVEHAVEAIYWMDADARLVYVNETACRMLGYVREELLSMTAHDVAHNFPPERWVRHWEKVKARGSITAETYHRASDGRLIPVEVTISYVQVEGQEYDFAFARDLTKQRQAEEALKESKEQFRSLYNNATIGLYRTTPAGQILMINPTGLRMLGFDTFEELAQRNLEEAGFEEQDARRQFRERLEREGTIEQESVWIKKDGTPIYVRESSTLSQDDNGDILYYDGSFEDITERKQAEAERARLQQEVIEAQQRALEELSTPVIPIMDRILVMPLIGSIDSLRARDITRALLVGIREHRARVVILDVTGVPIVDSGVANHLNKTIQAARLKGARTIVTGISDAVAETIVDLGIDWSTIETLSDLQTGLLAALGGMGIKLTR